MYSSVRNRLSTSESRCGGAAARAPASRRPAPRAAPPDTTAPPASAARRKPARLHDPAASERVPSRMQGLLDGYGLPPTPMHAGPHVLSRLAALLVLAGLVVPGCGDGG